MSTAYPRSCGQVEEIKVKEAAAKVREQHRKTLASVELHRGELVSLETERDALQGEAVVSALAPPLRNANVSGMLCHIPVLFVNVEPRPVGNGL